MTPVRSPQALGRAIRAARREAGMTQVELAARALAKRQTVIGLEAGHETRAVTAIFDALAALGLELVVRPRSSGRASGD